MSEIHVPMIHQAINACMAAMGAIGKTQRNEQQGWLFRGIDDVYNSLRPAMLSAGIDITPKILNREFSTTPKGATHCVVEVEYTLTCSADGSSTVVVTGGEAMDYGDKAYSKAQSMAYKYMAFQTFVIPTEEMRNDDPDRYVPDEKHEAETLRQKVEKVSVTKADKIAKDNKTRSRFHEVAKLMASIGREAKDASAIWHEMAEAGIIPKKRTNEMTDDEFATALEAIRSNFANG